MMSQYPVAIPDMITSAANDEVKRLRALHERKFRKQTGWVLAEGARICHEAGARGWAMHPLAFVFKQHAQDQRPPTPASSLPPENAQRYYN